MWKVGTYMSELSTFVLTRVPPTPPWKLLEKALVDSLIWGQELSSFLLFSLTFLQFEKKNVGR